MRASCSVRLLPPWGLASVDSDAIGHPASAAAARVLDLGCMLLLPLHQGSAAARCAGAGVAAAPVAVTEGGAAGAVGVY